MRQIFVFTAANAKAQENIGKSIENPVEDDKVFENFDYHHHEELERIRNEAGRFYAWGAVWGIRNVPTWEQMERDDFVLCVYDSIYHYVARLLAKYDNPRVRGGHLGHQRRGPDLALHVLLDQADQDLPARLRVRGLPPQHVLRLHQDRGYEA